MVDGVRPGLASRPPMAVSFPAGFTPAEATFDALNLTR